MWDKRFAQITLIEDSERVPRDIPQKVENKIIEERKTDNEPKNSFFRWLKMDNR